MEEKTKKITVGILAHVDAGKTTLSEAILYETGAIRTKGRVDHRDSFFDTENQERQRGITIKSKQAIFSIEDTEFTLLDTPGHVDFSAEAERTLRVLDYAILIVSARDMVTAQTKKIWEMVAAYNLPTFIFVNKMDLAGISKEEIKADLKENLSSNLAFFGEDEASTFEDIACCDEALLEDFLNDGKINDDCIKELIQSRKVFPVFFGSALKSSGVKEFLSALQRYSVMPNYSKDFGARVYKITRDEKGVRLTHLKVTGGKISVKELVKTGEGEEKINQIRQYFGSKFTLLKEATEGMVVAISGLDNTFSGQALGCETFSKPMSYFGGTVYKISYPSGTNVYKFINNMSQLEEELPELSLYVTDDQDILIRIIGDVQFEVLAELIKERFGIEVSFSEYVEPVYEEEVEEEIEEVDDRIDLNARWLPSQAAAGSSGSFDDELESIFERTYGPMRKKRIKDQKVMPTKKTLDAVIEEAPAEYLIVDGYNIIYAWDDLKELLKEGVAPARDALIEMMMNYKSLVNTEVIVVFDAYKIAGGQRRIENHGGVHVVYTKEAESADSYIEKITYEMKPKYKVRVVTSDFAEQVIVLGNSAMPVWANDFRKEYELVVENMRSWIKDYKLKTALENRNRIEIPKKQEAGDAKESQDSQE